MRKRVRRGAWLLFLAVLLVIVVERAGQRTEETVRGAVAASFRMPEEQIVRMSETAELPAAFDCRDTGCAPAVRDQGRLGTCWAFASLTALESSLLPEEKLEFSRDHLNLQNHFLLEPNEGGSYMISVSYLTAWQGPVLEQDDPYGDNYSPDGLTAVKHVQEVRLPDCKDYEAIKQTVYLYGGVETSIYVDFSEPKETSDYYNRQNFSYNYEGGEEPNHDVVIIGWDDRYPAENFNREPAGNGAFICQNSWGESFGEDGIFYVSYYDANIGSCNVAYTRVEDADNYDILYQSDLCGWSGQIGYNTDTACFANVYKASGDQVLRAVGFYAVGGDTEYRLAVIRDFEEAASLENVEYEQAGYLQYAGFYTMELETSVSVKQGEKFAVAVQLTTPGVSYPIAVEFASEELGGAVTLEDGEGYISADGKSWTRVEEEQNSNLCLKVYADEEET